MTFNGRTIIGPIVLLIAAIAASQAFIYAEPLALRALANIAVAPPCPFDAARSECWIAAQENMETLP